MPAVFEQPIQQQWTKRIGNHVIVQLEDVINDWDASMVHAKTMRGKSGGKRRRFRQLA